MATEPEADLNLLSHEVIGAAMAVHSALGAGFLEGVYEEALCVELTLRKIPFERQVAIAMKYRGFDVGQARLDLVVDHRIVVELKAINTLAPLQAAQLIAYLKATRLTVGLLINFNAIHLRSGIKRIINTC